MKGQTKSSASPKRYDEWLQEDKLFLLKMWARDGLTQGDIAARIGIAHKTLCEWQNRFPEIRKALSEGREFADYKVENALYKHAIGFKTKEIKTITSYPDKNGNRKTRMEITERFVPGNVTAMMAWLTNRKPDVWKRNRDYVTIQGDKDLTVKIVKAKSKKEE